MSILINKQPAKKASPYQLPLASKVELQTNRLIHRIIQQLAFMFCA